MKEKLEQYLSDESWHITEDGWDPATQASYESIFTLGNGYLSSRGALEGGPFGSSVGTYIAGIFDNTGAQVTELINAPNPFYIKITSKGEKLDNVSMDVLEHKRILDMKKGILYRDTVFSNSKKMRFHYRSLKFISMNNKHTGVIRIYLTPLDASSTFTVQSSIDVSVTNKGVLTEGRKKHFDIKEISKIKNVSYASVQTFQHKMLIGCASQLSVIQKNRKFSTSEPISKIKLKKNETVCITKIVSLYTSRRIKPKDLKRTVLNSICQKQKVGFEKLLKRNIESWNKKWNIADIKIKSDKESEKAIRFNICHMLICGPERGLETSIGARTLSGEGYRGHVFWDMEIFMLPFFVFTFPKVARNILLYRYNRLDAARKIARDKGYKGALFPWESADTGEETTPAWAKDLDGTTIEIKTMLEEHHINADIAYGMAFYCDVTGDYDFFIKYGVEILFETARFWITRVQKNVKTGEHEIKKVIGPNEFHESVNNNSFTNVMARWNLLRAYGAYTFMKKKKPSLFRKLLKKLKLKESEIKEWRHIAGKIKFPYSKKKKLVEEFDGYFKKKDVPITLFNKNSAPLFPKGISPRNVQSTQLIKQADVIMLLYLLPDLFSFDEKRRNYNYYEKRTLHKSSLSFSIHSIIASEIGNKDKAFLYFINSVMTDLKNIHGNTSEGIHAAALGGTWQAVVNGFGGIRIKKGTLNINPALPDKWQDMDFKLNWRGDILNVHIFKDGVRIYYRNRNSKKLIFVRIYNVLCELKPNCTNSFYKTKFKKRTKK